MTSNGVRVEVQVTADGWEARAMHAALEDGEGCSLYYSAAPAAEAGDPGEAAPAGVVCTN